MPQPTYCSHQPSNPLEINSEPDISGLGVSEGDSHESKWSNGMLLGSYRVRLNCLPITPHYLDILCIWL